MKRAFLSLVASLCLAGPLLAEVRNDATWESLDKRPVPAWFNQAKFGIFICWGPYSVPSWSPKGSYAEWYGWNMNQKGNPCQLFHERVFGKDFTYKQFGPMMKGELFDADLWADFIARSGAKYIALTSTYHDGFALFPSPYSPGWNAMDTGPKRDVLAEVSAAVRKRGVRFGIYYSLYEWYHPLWLKDRKKYVQEHYIPQFKEVVTKYKPSFIFADGEWEGDAELWRAKEMLSWLFNESPVKDEVVINDRMGGSRGKHGTIFSSEYGGGNFPPTHPWQEDRGMGASYGYNRNETIDEYDSPATMVQMLCKCAGNGGNLLLNVGPTADGRFPVIMQERLVQIGAWLKANGEAIHGAKASPFWPRKFPWGTCTYKPSDAAGGGPGTIYAIVYGRPTGSIELFGLKNKVKAAWLLADAGRKPLATESKDAGLVVQLPLLADEAANVIALEIEGELAVDLTIRQQADGTVRLRAAEAVIHGRSPAYEVGQNKDNIGYWHDAKDYVSWQFAVDKPGAFDVEVTYSCAAGAGGSAFAVEVGAQKVQAVSEETGSWEQFASRKLGTVRIDQAGTCILAVKPQTPPAWKVIGLRSVVLRPAK